MILHDYTCILAQQEVSQKPTSLFYNMSSISPSVSVRIISILNDSTPHILCALPVLTAFASCKVPYCGS